MKKKKKGKKKKKKEETKKPEVFVGGGLGKVDFSGVDLCSEVFLTDLGGVDVILCPTDLFVFVTGGF